MAPIKTSLTKEINSQDTDWGKIPVIHVSDRGPFVEYIKSTYKSIIKTKNSIFKIGKNLNTNKIELM